jgi:catechol 2,3-dioxygenase-like lactoylglutathione lyase family enzyme
MPSEGPLGMRRAAPILPVGDLEAAFAFYARLGFELRRYDDGYGYARRERLILHLRVSPEVDPRTNPSAGWVDVADVDALHAEWLGLGLRVRTGVAGREPEPLGAISARVERKPWGVREFAILDPDNNQLRFGAPDERRD